MAFIAHEKTQGSYRIVTALPDGTRSTAEWEAYSTTLPYDEAQKLLAELLFADRYGALYPGWGGEGYGGAGYDPSIDG